MFAPFCDLVSDEDGGCDSPTSNGRSVPTVIVEAIMVVYPTVARNQTLASASF